MKHKTIKIISIILVIIISMIIIDNTNQVYAATTYYQYVKTGIGEFPKSYQERLQELSNKYPNWRFQAYYTGISWDELIKKERDDSVYKNRVTATAPLSWKHCDFVDDGWACASDAAVKYYLDPRNFLNETQIFQFVETSYNEKVQTLSAIQNSVKETFLDKTITCKDLNNNIVTMSYSQIIIEAAKKTNISAFYIKSKIIQEVGTTGSGSVTGTYPGYEGYYNFFNYGAYDDGNDIANGLSYAKKKGWDSQYKAIVRGAELIGKYYINQGQNTAYFNKWDVVGTKILKDGESQTVSSSDMFWHQYMTNIQDPSSQAYSNKKLYANSLDSQITFIIPVYDNMPSSNPMPRDISVESISMNKERVIVNIDEKDKVEVTINPSSATNKNLIWTSSNPDVVRVWEGEFRGLKEGISVLTATSQDGNKTASCTVIVRDPNKKYVEDIIFEKEQYIVNIDQAEDINYEISPSDSTNSDLDWISSDSEILRVYYNRFRALKEGKAEVIARTKDGTVEKRMTVIVRNPNKEYVEDIKIEKTEYVIAVDEAVDIEYSYSPENSINAQFEWLATDSEVLRVYYNRFRGLKEGTAEVIVRTKDGTIEKRIKVTVKKTEDIKVEDIQFEKTEYIIGVDEAIDIPYSYTPLNSSNAEFSWTTDNPDVIRVYWNRIRGLKEGTANLIVRTLDGSIEKILKIVVSNDEDIKVEEIQFEKTEYTIRIDEAIDIPYKLLNNSNLELSWTTDNPEIIRVYWNRIRGLKEGTANLIVRSSDGSIEKKIKVIVKKPEDIKVEEIQFEQTEYTIGIDEAIDIPYTYAPSSSSNAEFSWTTDNPEVIRVYWNRIRGLKEGTANLIVRTLDGTVEKTIKIIVK